MTTNPFIKLSIVIPAYNEEAYIGPCLDAVLEETRRAPCPVEVIVVDNASQDRTAEIARAFSGVRVVSEMTKGLVRARQAGFEAAHGEFIANVDADTRMPTGWIESAIALFNADPGLVALSGPCSYYDLSLAENFWIRVSYRFGMAASWIYSSVTGRSGTMFQGGNSVIRRSALLAAGGFDQGFDFYGEDVATAKRLRHEGKVRFIWQFVMPVSARRLRGEGMLAMAWKYSANLVWTTFFGRPYSREYRDIR